MNKFGIFLPMNQEIKHLVQELQFKMIQEVKYMSKDYLNIMLKMKKKLLIIYLKENKERRSLQQK